jgi:hypothetical protein
MKFFVFGIDGYKNCGTLSNVDFKYFVWQNSERSSSKQYAITLIPSDIISLSTPPMLLCLKYYRAASDGWKDAVNYDICDEQYQACVRTQRGCSQPETCFCTTPFLNPFTLWFSVTHLHQNGPQSRPF